QWRNPSRFGDRGVIRQCLARGGAVRVQDRGEMETLRRLYAPKAGTVDGSGDKPVCGALDRVAKRQPRNGGGAAVEATDDAVDQRGIGKWPSAIVDQHTCRSVRG